MNDRSRMSERPIQTRPLFRTGLTLPNMEVTHAPHPLLAGRRGLWPHRCMRTESRPAALYGPSSSFHRRGPSSPQGKRLPGRHPCDGSRRCLHRQAVPGRSTGHSLHLHLQPGSHTLAFRSEGLYAITVNRVTFDAEAGHQYSTRCTNVGSFAMGGGTTYNYTLEVVDNATGRAVATGQPRPPK